MNQSKRTEARTEKLTVSLTPTVMEQLRQRSAETSVSVPELVRQFTKLGVESRVVPIRSTPRKSTPDESRQPGTY